MLPIKIRNMLYKDEGPPAKKEQIPVPAAKKSGWPPMPEKLPPPPPPPLPTSGVYQSLKDKVDFDQSDAGVILAKYLAPLKAIPDMDERAKYRAAVAQAGALEGLTVERVLATFDGLKRTLQDEMVKFERAAADLEHDNADKIRERDELQAKLDAVRIELQSSTAKVNKTRSDFKDAVTVLSNELDKQKATFTDLLKG